MKHLIVVSTVLCAFFLISFTPPDNHIEYYSNGKIKTIYNINNNRDIYFSSFYENGELKQTGYYVDSEKARTWISYNQSGERVSVAQFKNGLKHGKWKIFDNSGNLKYEILYAEDFVKEAVEYNVDGSRIAFMEK